MSLSPNFKKEYKDFLKECLIIVDKSRKYDTISSDYNILKNKINEILEDLDLLCNDCETCLDKKTGELKPNVEIILNSNSRLLEMIKELSKLYKNKLIYEIELGWNDELKNHIDTVLAIANYRDMEKAIISEFGKSKGRYIVYEIKKDILKFEDEIGIYFYRYELEKLEALLKVEVLYLTSKELEITLRDNLKEENLILYNEKGENFKFKKNSQIKYQEKIYVELELLEEIKAPKLSYYLLEKTQSGQKFILEEDENICNYLWDRQDKLSIYI